MSVIYGNLGSVHHVRGEFDRAEDIYERSLALSEALGFKESAAVAYSATGQIFNALHYGGSKAYLVLGRRRVNERVVELRFEGPERVNLL